MNEPVVQFPFQLPVVHEPQLTGCTIRLKLETPTVAFAVVVDQQAFRDGKKVISDFIDNIPQEAGAQLVGVLYQVANTVLGTEVPEGDEALEAPEGSDAYVGMPVALREDLSKKGVIVAILDDCVMQVQLIGSEEVVEVPCTDLYYDRGDAAATPEWPHDVQIRFDSQEEFDALQEWMKERLKDRWQEASVEDAEESSDEQLADNE